MNTLGQPLTDVQGWATRMCDAMVVNARGVGAVETAQDDDRAVARASMLLRRGAAPELVAAALSFYLSEQQAHTLAGAA